MDKKGYGGQDPDTFIELCTHAELNKQAPVITEEEKTLCLRPRFKIKEHFVNDLEKGQVDLREKNEYVYKKVRFKLPVVLLGWQLSGKNGNLQGEGNERRGIVTSYVIKYIAQNGKWANLNNSKTGKEVFKSYGNLAQPDTVTTVNLANPITTQALRIYPELWEGSPYFKIKLQLCDPEYMSQPILKTRNSTTQDSTTEPARNKTPKHDTRQHSSKNDSHKSKTHIVDDLKLKSNEDHTGDDRAGGGETDGNKTTKHNHHKHSSKNDNHKSKTHIVDDLKEDHTGDGRAGAAGGGDTDSHKTTKHNHHKHSSKNDNHKSKTHIVDDLKEDHTGDGRAGAAGGGDTDRHKTTKHNHHKHSSKNDNHKSKTHIEDDLKEDHTGDGRAGAAGGGETDRHKTTKHNHHKQSSKNDNHKSKTHIVDDLKSNRNKDHKGDGRSGGETARHKTTKHDHHKHSSKNDNHKSNSNEDHTGDGGAVGGDTDRHKATKHNHHKHSSKNDNHKSSTKEAGLSSSIRKGDADNNGDKRLGPVKHEQACKSKSKWRYTKTFTPKDDVFTSTGNSLQAWRAIGSLSSEPFQFNLNSKNKNGKKIKKQFLEISFKTLTKIFGLKVAGSSSEQQWGCITRFGLLYKFEKQMTWVYYKDNFGTPKVFKTGKRTIDSCSTPVTFHLPVAIVTTTLRIYPTRWEGLPKLHVNFLTCQLEGVSCVKPLLANGQLKRLQFGNMDKNYQEKNSIYYITIKLSQHTMVTVKAVKFQQGPNNNSITKFVLQFNDENNMWHTVKDKDGGIVEYSTDDIVSKSKPTVVFFSKPFETKLIKLYPQAWEGLSPTIKIDFIGCGTNHTSVKGVSKN